MLSNLDRAPEIFIPAVSLVTRDRHFCEVEDLADSGLGRSAVTFRRAFGVRRMAGAVVADPVPGIADVHVTLSVHAQKSTGGHIVRDHPRAWLGTRRT